MFLLSPHSISLSTQWRVDFIDILLIEGIFCLVFRLLFFFSQLKEYQQKNNPGATAGTKKKRKTKEGSRPETPTSDEQQPPENVSVSFFLQIICHLLWFVGQHDWSRGRVVLVQQIPLSPGYHVCYSSEQPPLLGGVRWSQGRCWCMSDCTEPSRSPGCVQSRCPEVCAPNELEDAGFFGCL